MKRIAFFAAIASTTLALPAQANSGIGLLVMWIPAAIVALLPAIVIEAIILARLLGQRFPRALGISASANIASTLAGAAIAIVLDLALFWSWGSSGAPPGRGAMLVSLVPMFFITWWIEHLVVRRKLRGEAKPPPKSATFIANAATYALMAVAIWFSVAGYGESLTRENVAMALQRMAGVKTEVTEYHALHKTFPPPRAYEPATHVKSLALEPNGRIVLTFSFPNKPGDDGKRIFMEPRVADGKIVEWTCSSPDIRPGFLPASCRR